MLTTVRRYCRMNCEVPEFPGVGGGGILITGVQPVTRVTGLGDPSAISDPPGIRFDLQPMRPTICHQARSDLIM